VAIFVVTAVVLAVFNITRGLGAFGSFDDLAAVGLLVVLAVGAWWTGATRDQLGLRRSDARTGLAWGAGAFLLVLVAVVLAAIVPATSGFLDDSRADVSLPTMVVEVAFVILVATVLPEELAFRGILLGVGRDAWGAWRATLVSSALFGVWHISPTLGTMTANAQLAGTTESTGGQVLVVVGSVAVTFVAGLVFCWLRLRSRSLVAPVIAHLATNGVAFVVAWTLLR
jgi:membrane protease YdiL (CAAX protease family)